MWKVKINPLIILKCRFQGPFHSRKVVKSVFEPTFYRNILWVKIGSCTNTFFTTLWATKNTLKSIFYHSDYLGGLFEVTYPYCIFGCRFMYKTQGMYQFLSNVSFNQFDPTKTPSVIHGWKATDLLYEMVRTEKIFFWTCEASYFWGRSQTDFLHDLRARLT